MSKGWARITQSPRGAILKVNGFDVGRVYANSSGWNEYNGWYWTAVYGSLASDDKSIPPIPLTNTYKTPTNELEEAKKSCEAYVRGILARA